MRFQPRSRAGGSWQQNRGLVSIPLVLIVMITFADILSPQDVHLGPLLVVAPAITASFGGSRLTAFVGVLAIGALFAIAAVRNSVSTANHESQLASLILISAFLVVFSRLRERSSVELRQVRSVAEAAQEVVLQPLPERIGALTVAFAYQAAADQARIGGDLYAAVRTRNGTRLLIGDVRGKGLAAVDDASLLLGAFRSAAHRELTLPELHAELEATVSWGLSQPARLAAEAEADESFITSALIDVPDESRVVRILNSGHPPPLRLHAGTVTSLAPSRDAPPMGLGLTQEPDTVIDTFAFGPGDILLLYTDGVSEARDETGRFYPLADRLAAFADSAGPPDLLARLHHDLLEYSHEALDDDVALVAVRCEPAPAPPSPPAPVPDAGGAVGHP